MTYDEALDAAIASVTAETFDAAIEACDIEELAISATDDETGVVHVDAMAYAIAFDVIGDALATLASFIATRGEWEVKNDLAWGVANAYEDNVSDAYESFCEDMRDTYRHY